MSQSVDRLKELLFDSETLALQDLARRIDGVSAAETKARDELASRLELIVAAEAKSRDELARRIDSLSDLDARARDNLKAQLDDIYTRAGSTEHMTQSVSEVISEALRRAEVARHAELSQTISPLVVSTIKTELRNSQDEMVEALYPITGRLVKSYIASAIKDLTEQMNRRLEQNPVMLRLQSLSTGRPVGELALAATQTFDVKELYLIRRGSGELVAHWPENANSGREHAMSGVLAAVNEFASEAFSASDQHLRQIDLGGEEVYLRGSPVYLLAARCSGHAPKAIEQTIDDAFLSAVEMQHGIDNQTPYGTDASRAKAAALAKVGRTLQDDVSSQIQEFRRPAGKGTLKFFAALILLPLIGWYAWSWYETFAIGQMRATAQRIIVADPAMTGYPVDVGISGTGEELTVSGLTPSEQAKVRIITDLKRSLPKVTLRDKLTVVAGSGITIPDVTPELARVRREISGAMTDVARAALTRANTRADTRLRQAEGDLSRAAPSLTDGTQTEALTRIAKDIATLRADLQPLAETAQTLPTADDNGEHSAAYQALTERLGTLSNDVLRAIGGSPAPVAQTSNSAAAIDGAVEQFADESERLAALAATVTAAKLLRPPPAAPVIVPPAPAPMPTPRERLEAWTRNHAIFFAGNLDYRDPSAAQRWMVELADQLKANPILIRVVGYTDEIGGAVRNVPLAQDRANKVRGELIALGVRPELLATVGRASAFDLSDTRGATSPNRRVQFELGFEGEPQP